MANYKISRISKIIVIILYIWRGGLGYVIMINKIKRVINNRWLKFIKDIILDKIKNNIEK